MNASLGYETLKINRVDEQKVCLLFANSMVISKLYSEQMY